MTNLFINAGNPDCFNPKTLQAAQVTIDPRCVKVTRSGAATWLPAFGMRACRASTTPRYFALRVLDSGADPAATGIGLVQSGTESAVAAPGISVTGVMAWGSNIIFNTVSNQSGLTPFITNGVVAGLSLYREAGLVKVQFYVNRTPMGTPVTIPDVAYVVTTATYYTGAVHVGCFDRDDMDFLPAGHQPWGSFMRLSDVGGYSPAPLKFAAFALGTSADVDGHTLNATATQRGARLGRTYGTQNTDPSPNTVRVFAVRIVTVNATLSGVGLISAAASLSTYPGGVIGSGGIYWQGGTSANKRFDAGTATAIPLAGSWVNTTLLHVFWQPSSGYVWFAKDGAVIDGGLPNTASAPSLVLGFGREMFPFVNPGSGSSMRIMTHRSEIPFLEQWPNVQPWDDSELLSEQHYKGRLSSNTEITQSIWFPMPWGGSRTGGTTVGAIEALNGDGFYDGVGDHEVLDTGMRIVEMINDRQYPVVNCICDAVRTNKSATLTLLSRDRAMLLEKHLTQPVFAIGQVGRAPPKASTAQSNAFDIAHTSLLRALVVLDQGVAMSSVGAGNDNVVKGFRRSAAVIGKQAASFNVMQLGTQIALPNGDLALWTSDNPNSWTVTELNTATNKITQNPAGQAQFVRGVGTAAVNMFNGTIPVGQRRAVRVVVSAWVSGSLLVYGNVPPFGTMYSTDLQLAGVGTYWAILDATGAAGIGRMFLEATDGSNFTVDQVDIWPLEETNGVTNYFAPLLALAGVPIDAVTGQVGNHTLTGYWADTQPTIRAMLDATMEGWLTDYYTDETGRLVFVNLLSPRDNGSAWTLTEADAVDQLDREDDLAPRLSDSGMENYAFSTYSTSELAGTILTPPATQVPFLTQQFQANKFNLALSSSVSDAFEFHSFYKHAVGAPPFKRYCPETLSNDGRQASMGAGFDYELYTLHRCYMFKMAFWKRTYKADRVREQRMALGTVGTLQHARHGATNKRVFYIGRRRRLRSFSWLLTFWG